MHLDHEGVGAGRHGGKGERRHQVALAGRVRHVDAHRAQRLLVDHRDGGDVQREARGRLERADAALAQHHVVVAFRREVVGGGQPFGDGARETALVQHHLVRLGGDLADFLQQAEVLEVARAYLQAVHVGVDQLAVRRVHDLGERFQAVLLAGIAHDLEGLLAQALERVRVRAGLERAAANPGEAEARDAFGHFFELLGRLDGARAGEDGDLVGAGAQVGDGGYLRFAHTDGVSFMILRMVA